MSDQPEALKLAGELEYFVGGVLCSAAAAELRRLHAENERLRAECEALYKANVAATAAYEQWLTESKERGQKAEAECDALRAALRAMVGVYGNDHHPTAQEALRKARAALKEEQ